MTGLSLIIFAIAAGLGAIFIVDFSRRWCKKDSCTAMMWGAFAVYFLVILYIAAVGI
jgi:hypothetical protein